MPFNLTHMDGAVVIVMASLGIQCLRVRKLCLLSFTKEMIGIVIIDNNTVGL